MVKIKWTKVDKANLVMANKDEADSSISLINPNQKSDSNPSKKKK